MPAATCPCGCTSDGRPVGLQVDTARSSDANAGTAALPRFFSNTLRRMYASIDGIEKEIGHDVA